MTLADSPQQTLPRPTRDVERAFDDLDRFGYAIVEGALSRERVLHRGVRQFDLMECNRAAVFADAAGRRDYRP